MLMYLSYHMQCKIDEQIILHVIGGCKYDVIHTRHKLRVEPLIATNGHAHDVINYHRCTIKC
jgi:hypothetical protein